MIVQKKTFMLTSLGLVLALSSFKAAKAMDSKYDAAPPAREQRAATVHASHDSHAYGAPTSEQKPKGSKRTDKVKLNLGQLLAVYKELIQPKYGFGVERTKEFTSITAQIEESFRLKEATETDSFMDIFYDFEDSTIFSEERDYTRRIGCRLDDESNPVEGIVLQSLKAASKQKKAAPKQKKAAPKQKKAAPKQKKAAAPKKAAPEAPLKLIDRPKGEVKFNFEESLKISRAFVDFIYPHIKYVAGENRVTKELRPAVFIFNSRLEARKAADEPKKTISYDFNKGVLTKKGMLSEIEGGFDLEKSPLFRDAMKAAEKTMLEILTLKELKKKKVPAPKPQAKPAAAKPADKAKGKPTKPADKPAAPKAQAKPAAVKAANPAPKAKGKSGAKPSKKK